MPTATRPLARLRDTDQNDNGDASEVVRGGAGSLLLFPCLPLFSLGA
jgi:hypothetical protein